MIVGGVDKPYDTLNDMWFCDTTTKLWKKVLFLVTVLSVHKQAIMFMSCLVLIKNIYCAFIILLCKEYLQSSQNGTKL